MHFQILIQKMVAWIQQRYNKIIFALGIQSVTEALTTMTCIFFIRWPGRSTCACPCQRCIRCATNMDYYTMLEHDTSLDYPCPRQWCIKCATYMDHYMIPPLTPFSWASTRPKLFLGIWEVPKVFLISTIDFYYVINKLIVLLFDPH
jgi:hypothetical protein